MRRITFDEFMGLRQGDVVFIMVGETPYKSGVLGQPFFNNDADEPDYEIETTNGFSDVYSLYI